MKNFLTSDQEFRHNEILFENRNKNYGAYVLRSEEGMILRKSLFIGVALFAAMAITPLLINAFTAKNEVKDTIGEGHVLKPFDEVPEKEPEVVKPAAPQKVIETTVKIEIPTPVKNPVKETPPPSVNQIRDTKIGQDNIIGDPPSIGVSIPVTVDAPVKAQELPVPKAADDTPVSKVDVEAGFNGGINSFRSKVVQNFNTADFEGTGDLMKTTVTFIVEKDGTISSIKANGKDADFNTEAEKTIKKIKGKWTPAKLNGENVRSYFKFPISMQFE